jgi:hypothetical protein
VLGAHLLTQKIPAQNARAVGPYPSGPFGPGTGLPASTPCIPFREQTDCGMTRTMPDRKVILDTVTLACRAPSLHNSQPWRWKVADGAALHLFADRKRLVRHR